MPLRVPVASGPQHQEACRAAAGIGGALGLGQHDEHLAVAVGRKPLETVQEPGISVPSSRRLQGPEVGAAGPFGQQLRGFTFPFAGGELGQDMFADIGRGVGGDQ
jgi:hypothetical protein